MDASLIYRPRTRAIWNEDSFLQKRAADALKDLGAGAAMDTEHDAEPVAKKKKLNVTEDRKKSLLFMDIAIAGVMAGRITFRLYYDITPKTCENFRALVFDRLADSIYSFSALMKWAMDTKSQLFIG